MMVSISTNSQFTDDIHGWHLKRAYTELGSLRFFTISQVLFGDVRAYNAEAGGGFGGELPEFEEVAFFAADESNSLVSDFWFRGFTIINHCNSIIDSIGDSGSDINTVSRYTAEARFIRALTFFTLANIFDTIPAPTVSFEWPLEESTVDFFPSNKVPEPSLSLNEVYTIVEGDLKLAIPNLPMRSSLEENEYYRATKGAAQALLGKVLLYESSFATNLSGDNRFTGFTERWDEALDVLNAVIQSLEFAMIGSPQATWRSTETPAFRAVFTSDLNGSVENVFSLKNIELGNGYSTWRGLGHTHWTMVRNVKNEFGDPTLSGGWGVIAPNQDLINAFAAETGTVAADDPRFTTTIGLEGDTVQISQGWTEMTFPADGLIASNRKWECSAAEYWNVSLHWLDSPIDLPIIRFSDVLLMASEAAYMNGAIPEALDHINMVRTRAESSGTTGKPELLTTLSMDDIMLERRVELALEGHRFYDLLRWGILYETLDNRYYASLDTNIAFVEGVHEFLPYNSDWVGNGGIGAIMDLSEARIDLYPNPGDGDVEIRSNERVNWTEVYNLSGVLVMEKKFSDMSNTHINITNLESGIYIIQFHTEIGIQTKRYIKK
jgi:hypothetical protein